MSRGRIRLAAGLAILLLGGMGCWEQVNREWFPQMKEQPAVQAFENEEPRVPPEGTIPLGGIEPRIAGPVPAFTPQAIALQNRIPATPASIERGREVYGVYCTVCHGADGMAKLEELPVASRLSASGMPPPPLLAVPGYTDGFLFTKIRYGQPGMPGYPQIPPGDRWHVVNYLRTLIPRPGS